MANDKITIRNTTLHDIFWGEDLNHPIGQIQNTGHAKHARDKDTKYQ